MTAGTILVETPEDAIDTTARWDLGSTGALQLTEQWGREKATRKKSHSFTLVSAAEQTDLPAKNEFAPADSVQFSFGETEHLQPRSNPLRASFEALSKARRKTSAADWLEAAVTLKREAVQIRNSRSRHAAVLLALADALTFTEPDDPTLDPEAATALDSGLALLSEPFLSEPDEENFLDDLLGKGWNLLPSAPLEPLEASR